MIHCATFQNVTWLPMAACPYNQDVALFRLHLADYPMVEPHLRGLLQPHEIDRAQRYRSTRDQQRSIYSRGLLRLLVGKYINQPPQTIEFVPGVNKKPTLKEFPDLHVNVSHSGQWVLVVIGKAAVGVDVEAIHPDFSFSDLLPHNFSSQEQQYIQTSSDVRTAFYQLWTRKEALVKATGKGLDDDFCRIPSLDGEHRVSDELLGQPGNWTVRSFPLADAYSASVTYQAGGSEPVFYAVDDSLFMKSP